MANAYFLLHQRWDRHLDSVTVWRDRSGVADRRDNHAGVKTLIAKRYQVMGAGGTRQRSTSSALRYFRHIVAPVYMLVHFYHLWHCSV